MNKLYIALALGTATLSILSSCKVSIPEGAKAVKPFSGNKYLGKWYEIARLDFKFEKNLNDVTAEYSKGEEGMIKVVNRGYNVKKKEWKQSTGKARFVRDPQEGRLKVSFFGPFYAGYNVIAIDKEYRYALVAGNNLEYLWILSREKTMPEEIKRSYLEKAENLGYKTKDLIWTTHHVLKPVD